jgi:outer membrane lipase/esterase
MTALSRLPTASSHIPRRRALASLATLGLGLGTLLAGCGSGDTFEPLSPTRVISFGDGWSDLGQTSGKRYTVNDGSTNIWVQQMAANYSRSISPSTSGGLGFAYGGARVDTGANAISSQITTFLAANTIGTSDLLVIDAGIAELAALGQDRINGILASDSALNSAADTAGRALAAQVRRLTAAGGKHVVIANAPDLGKTPYASTNGRQSAFTAATRTFNDAIKLALADVTSGVLLIDNEAYVNLLYNDPDNYFDNSDAKSDTAACSTASALDCTQSTLASGVSDYNIYLFADDRHPTPAAHRLIGDNAYNKIKARW